MVLDFEKVDRAGRFTEYVRRDSDRYIIWCKDNLSGESYDWPDHVGVRVLIDKWCQQQEEKYKDVIRIVPASKASWPSTETPW